MQHPEKPNIHLYDIESAHIVIEFPSGVQYTNQVGGVICYRASTEGALVPLDMSSEQYSLLEQCEFPTGKQGIDDVVADSIDSVLKSERATAHLEVDRSLLGSSWEAWVYVRFLKMPSEFRWPVDGYFGAAFGFGNRRAILTWQNSD